MTGLTVVLALGCSRSAPKVDPAPAPSSAVAVASSSPAAAASASAPSAAPSDSIAVAAPALVPVVPPRPLPTSVASTVVPTPSAATPPTPPRPPPKPVASRLSSPAWNIDFSSGGCTAGAQCSALLRVEALGDYHVNPEYHFRFVPSAGSATVYSAGTPADFVLQGPKVGVMTVGFRASAAGTANLAGTFKICVCTDSACQPEQVAVALAVPVDAP